MARDSCQRPSEDFFRLFLWNGGASIEVTEIERVVSSQVRGDVVVQCDFVVHYVGHCTHGSSGLQYRYRFPAEGVSVWTKVPPWASLYAQENGGGRLKIAAFWSR